MATYQYVNDGRPDGALFGHDASDLIGFHGKAPSDQSAAATSVAATFTKTSAFGFSTSARAQSVLAAINAVIVCLKEKGLMAAS